MQTWLFDAAIFAAGLCFGILFARVWARLSPAQRRKDLSTARHHILARLRETHDEEILHEAFRATEALRTELSKSLHSLRASMSLVAAPSPGDHAKEAASQVSQTAGITSGQS